MAETAPVILGHRLNVILQVFPGARLDIHPPSYVRSLVVAFCKLLKNIRLVRIVVVPWLVTVRYCEVPPHRVTVPKSTVVGEKLNPATEIEVGSCAMLLLVLLSPPPETVAMLVTLAAALDATRISNGV
jgi:hypothetical protein